MRNVIICSRQGYEKLERAQIQDRTHKKRDALNRVFLFRSIWQDEPEKVASEIKNSSGTELQEDREDLQELERKLDEETNIFQMEPFVFENPLLVGRLVFGDDLDNFSKYEFKTKTDFARTIVAYCICEREEIQRDSCSVSWRNETYKNSVKLINHGDLSVLQKDITGRLGEDIIINPCSQGFGLKQDWSPFLVSVLKYAEAIGKKEIPEIRDWRTLARKLRTANVWSTNIPDKSDKEPEFQIKQLFLSGLTPIEYPIHINSEIFPMFSEGSLEILRENPQGDIKLFRGTITASKIISYSPEDIPFLLKANYQLFARSVNDMAQIMDYFNSKKTTITAI
jgi:hypothetical protein